MNEEKKKNNKRKQKHKKHNESDYSLNHQEILRIQGLVICKNCNNPCPVKLEICPTCGDKA